MTAWRVGLDATAELRVGGEGPKSLTPEGVSYMNFRGFGYIRERSFDCLSRRFAQKKNRGTLRSG